MLTPWDDHEFVLLSNTISQKANNSERKTYTHADGQTTHPFSFTCTLLPPNLTPASWPHLLSMMLCSCCVSQPPSGLRIIAHKIPLAQNHLSVSHHLLLCGFFFHSLTLDREEWKESRKWEYVIVRLLLIRCVKFLGRSLIFEVRISNFFFLLSCFFFVHDYLTNCHQQEPTPTNHKPTSVGALAFMYPLKSSQNFKHHTITETICSWQKHASAKAWGKSQSPAVKQSHILTPGIKTKTYISVFFKTSILSLHLIPFLCT